MVAPIIALLKISIIAQDSHQTVYSTPAYLHVEMVSFNQYKNVMISISIMEMAVQIHVSFNPDIYASISPQSVPSTIFLIRD